MWTLLCEIEGKEAMIGGRNAAAGAGRENNGYAAKQRDKGRTWDHQQFWRK